MYEEILELCRYCQSIGLEATLQPLHDGYKICFNNGSDIVQHKYSYRSDEGYVEPAIGSRADYMGIPLKNAKAIVKYHKDRLNKKSKKK